MMRKTNEGQSPVGILLPSVLAGLLGTLLLMLLGAVLVHRGTLAEGAIAPCALVFLALGSALAALVAAKRAGENQFYWSLGAGCGFSDPADRCGAAARSIHSFCTHGDQPALLVDRLGTGRLRRCQYAEKEALQPHQKIGGKSNEAYFYPDFCNPEADCSTRRLRRVPDFLPVRMQDFLHRGKPEVRARKVITLKRNMQGAPAGAPCSCISEENK